MLVEDGTGSGRKAGVDASNRLQASVRQNIRGYYKCKEGDFYTIIAVDAGPVAAEYTLYFKNDHSIKPFIISAIQSYATDADVVWKLHAVTGTSAGTAIIPVNTNLASNKPAETTCRGGAAGVTGLTSTRTIAQWYNGPVNMTVRQDINDRVHVGPGQAIAIEYDAGTGGAVLLMLTGYYDED